jgi:hypothetical protein
MSIPAGKFLQCAQNIGFRRSLAKGFFVRGDEKKVPKIDTFKDQ